MYKLAIQDSNLGLQFQVKYENLDKLVKPEIEARAPDGSIVKEKTVYQGTILQPGSTTRQYMDDSGIAWPKNALKFFYNNEEVKENEMTKTFIVSGYQNVKNYTDMYVISKYYELYPHNNDANKDYDKELARISNLTAMKKLWDHLYQNKLCARGEMNVSSRGFVNSDGYLRAIEVDSKWGLELGIFNQAKKFEALYDNVPIVAPQAPAATTRKIKMI